MSENKKILTRVEHLWQAEFIGNEHRQASIPFTIVEKAREYFSILTGLSDFRFMIYVAEENYDQALKKAKLVPQNLKVVPDFATEDSMHSEDAIQLQQKNYFQRVIAFSFLGMFALPLVFNYAATSNFFLLKNQSLSKSKIIFATLILILGWLVAIGIVFTFTAHFFSK